VTGSRKQHVSSAVDSEPLIRNVADTARWVAFYRALETERSDALFRDPYARMLAGERGERIVAAMGGSRGGQWLLTTRTVLIDHLVCGEIAKGADMVINLAAGLDARPYRLNLPPELTWVEVDVDDLITQKEDLLKDEKPVCGLERYRLNLVDTVARRNLFSELSQRTNRAVILSEGLVMYLSPDDVRSLSIDLADAQTFNCWILDLHHPRLLGANGRGRMGRMLAAANAQFRFAPAEGPAFFEPLGWRCVQVESILKAAVRLGRVPLLLRMLVPLFERHSSKRGYSWSGVSLLERRSVTA
jgi:methyltransferase (TIGR00027 family)